MDEVKTGIIEGAVHIEWTEIGREIKNLDIPRDYPLYLYCRSGNRSGKAIAILEEMGFTNLTNIGGISDAAQLVEKKIVKYSE